MYSDHSTLKWIKTQPRLSDKLVQWSAFIDTFDFDLSIIKGKSNVVADALSRRSDFFGATVFYLDVGNDLKDRIRQGYATDPIWKTIMDVLAKDPTLLPNYKITDGLLFLLDQTEQRLCIPHQEEIKSMLIGECHDAEGRFGFKKTYAEVREHFEWKGLKEDVLTYVRTCLVCQRNKPSHENLLGLLRPLPISSEPGESISMNFMSLTKSRNDNGQVMVIVDRFL